MRIHHLNCATMCPRGGFLLGGRGFLDREVRLVCHCLLIETPTQGLVLVESGLGRDDVMLAERRLGPFVHLARPRLRLEETAAHQVEALGFARSDVRHIVLTHMDLDHAGGLADFPEARVHVMRTERQFAEARPTLKAKRRYLRRQWAHGPQFSLYDPPRGAPWFGFEAVRDLRDLPPELLLVPLLGHTPGHAGVAVKTAQGWLLHAGDAYFHRRTLQGKGHGVPWGLRGFELSIATERSAMVHNQARLRELSAREAGQLDIFCAHDAVQFERLRARQQP